MSIYREKFEWIQEAIESILHQTIQDFEFIIIIDNDKLDGEIQNYLNKLSSSDRRIILISNAKNLGLATSLNVGLKHAVGTYIARMDADDISELNRFELEIEAMEQKQADVVSSAKVNIDESGREISRNNLGQIDPMKILPYENCMNHPSIIIKRSVLLDVGGYRNFKVSQDYDLWLRLLSTKCYKLIFLDKFLIKYRVRAESISSMRKSEQFFISQYQRQLYKERMINGVDSFSEKNLESYIYKKSQKQNVNKASRMYKKALNLIREKNPIFLLFLLKSLLAAPEYIIFRIKLKFILFYMSKIIAKFPSKQGKMCNESQKII